MPIDFPSGPTLGQQYAYGGVVYTYTAQGTWAAVGGSTGAGVTDMPQGRLTLQTATPVMTATVAGRTTLYYSPYLGSKVPIFDGTNMALTTFSELSVLTTDTTKNPAVIGASKVNDWFIWNDAGTLRLTHGPDWVNDNTRSAGTALVMVAGLWLNNASITNGPAAQRGTYVGTTRSNASSQLDWIFGGTGVGGVAGFFGVWNAYNRLQVAANVSDSTTSWTYVGTAVRPPNNSSNMRISAVFGLSEDVVAVSYGCVLFPSGGVNGSVGVGVNSTTAFSGRWGNTGVAGQNMLVGDYIAIAPLGFNFYQALEYCDGATETFVGSSSPYNKSGLFFEAKM